MKALAACLALLCCVLNTGSPARADDIVTVNASANFDSIEYFSAIFNWDATTNLIVPNTMDFASSGPLGSLSLTFANGEAFNWNSTSTPYFIQLDFGEDYNGHMLPDLGPYDLGDMILICETAECNSLNDFGSYGEVFIPAESGVVFVTATPEPSTLALTLSGLGVLFTAIIIRKCRRVAES